MGGREGSKGYLYQALISVLEALKDERWQNICVEYESKDDKVDIALKDNDGMLNVMQVKSSINTFTISNINKWIDLLINDVNDAEKFTLILIGNIDSKTKSYINSIDKMSRGSIDEQTKKNEELMPEIIKKNFMKINIKILNDDILNLELSMQICLYKLLYNKKISANPNQLELMVKALVYQFNVFSTNSQYITKYEFIDKIVKWASFNYNLNSEEALENCFDVMYYYKNKFTYENGRLVFTNSYRDDLENNKKKIKELYHSIKEINLPEMESKKLWISPLAKDFSLDIEIKDSIEKYFLNELDIKIENNFFDLGDMKEVLGMRNDGLIGTTIKGNQFEEEKYNLILELNERIKEIPILESKIEYLDYLSQYKVLPLCLKNISKKYIQDIEVTLRIPKDIDILIPDKIKIPALNIIGDIESIFKHSLVSKDDSNVKAYNGNKIHPYIGGINHYDALGLNKESDFINNIKSLFKYKFFDNEPEYIVLNCVFSEIRSGDVIMFPMHLLVSINSKFEIKYSIKTKLFSGIQEGVIEVS